MIFSNNKANSINLSETLIVLISMLKLISIEGLQTPSLILIDNVNTSDEAKENNIKNTTLGVFIIEFFEDIIKNLNEENEQVIETTFLEKRKPLGFKK